MTAPPESAVAEPAAHAGAPRGAVLGRPPVQFTIGRLMVVVAASAAPCWLARDRTAGPVARAFLTETVGPVARAFMVSGPAFLIRLVDLAFLLAFVLLVALAALWVVCEALNWLIDRSPARADPPTRPAACTPSDRISR